MLRKCVCLLWAVCMVVMVEIRGSALTQEGSLEVVPVWCGVPVEGGRISVSRVGSITPEGYRLTDGLANWTVESERLGEENWIRWLQQTSSDRVIAGKSGADGGEVFLGLEKGIYLVQQAEPAPGYSGFEPFLQSIPEGSVWDISIRPKVKQLGEPPKTEDHPAPIIAAMGIGLSAAVLMVMIDGRKK